MVANRPQALSSNCVNCRVSGGNFQILFSYRAFLGGNRDKQSFVNQHKSSGVFTKTFKEAFEKLFPNNK